MDDGGRSGCKGGVEGKNSRGACRAEPKANRQHCRRLGNDPGEREGEGRGRCRWLASGKQGFSQRVIEIDPQAVG